MSGAVLYRRKPVEVEAMRWGGTASGATTIIEWVLANGGTARYHDEEPIGLQSCIAIDTREGTIRAVALAEQMEAMF